MKMRSLLVAIYAALFASSAWGASVIDGDTIEIYGQRIRL
jgi:endonuclease YncB( thermonuclease family)